MAEKTAKNSTMAEIVDTLKSYILPLIAGIALALIAYFMYIPYVSQITAMIEEQETLKSNIETLDANLEKLNGFNNMPLDTMSSELDQLIPTEARVAELVEYLTGLASQTGLSVVIPVDENDDDEEDDENDEDKGVVKDIIAGESDAMTTYQVKRIPVTLSFSGTRGQVEEFVRLIRASRRVLSVESASIRVVGGIWQAELVIDGYKGEIITTSLPDYERIDADSSEVLKQVYPISIELTEAEFERSTERFVN